MAKAQVPKTVTLTYDLFELPTSQHRAGLAGLLLQIDSMCNRDKVAPTYCWDEQHPNTMLHVTFSEDTTTALFDDLYDATWIEGAPRDKPYYKGTGESKKEVPCVRRKTFTKPDKKGVEKTIEGYVYLELAPALSALRHYLPSDGGWVRLWQDFIWQVVRDSKKKAPYIQRAAAKAMPAGATVGDGAEDGESEDEEKGSADGSTWADLVKYHAGLAKQKFATGKLSSALLIGAQAKGAEELPFVGRIDQNLLLHFWPLACLVYVPRFVDSDGGSHIGRRDSEDKSKHFCLTVPDIVDVREFVQDYRKMLGGLSTEVAVFRPKEALIDLVAEGGLSFVEHLARLAPQVASGAETRSSVAGIDYLHLQQDGKIIRTRSTGRVAYSKYLAEDYRAIAGAYTNPLFRRGLLLALLDGRPWYRPFGKLFAEWDVSFFIPSDAPPKLSWFWIDARKKIQEVIQAMPTALNPNDSPDADVILMELLHRLTRTYLTARAKEKSGIDPEKFKEGDKIVWEKLPKDFNEARRAAGESLFYEFRSRRDQSFVAHFSQTFFATKQFLSADQYTEVGHALLNRTDDVKTLTLMALSANS